MSAPQDTPEAGALTTSSAAQPSWRDELPAVLDDLRRGWQHRRLWFTMALWDVKRRYRRTVLGPFWATLSHAVFVGAMGVIFSTLWQTDIATYLPFVASGFLCWVFVSSLVTEGCSMFTAATQLLNQTRLPFSVFMYGTLMRNLTLMGHHMVIYVTLLIFLPVPVTFASLLFFPGLLLVCLCGAWVTLLLGVACARYRDLQQAVTSILQISLFVTPIFWPAEQLGGRRLWIVEPNVLYHVVSLVREPLLGRAPSALNWLVVGGVTALGWGLTLYALARSRRTLIFWL